MQRKLRVTLTLKLRENPDATERNNTLVCSRTVQMPEDISLGNVPVCEITSLRSYKVKRKKRKEKGASDNLVSYPINTSHSTMRTK